MSGPSFFQFQFFSVSVFRVDAQKKEAINKVFPTNFSSQCQLRKLSFLLEQIFILVL